MSLQAPVMAERPKRFWQICNKAAQIFAKKGFDRTSLDDVAAELKITKPGLYYYFKSKDELLYAIILTHWEKLYGPIQKKLSQSSDPVENLRFAMTHHLGYVIDHPDASLLVEEKYSLHEDYLRAYKKMEKEYADEIRDQLVRLKKKGKLRKGIDPTVATYTLFSAINMPHRWYDPKGRVKPREYIRQVTEIFLSGILV